MPEIIKAACVQMTSGPDIAENLETSAAFIREAASKGAKLIATPENTDQMRRKTEDKLAAAGESNQKTIRFYSDLARELKVWLLIGSLGIKVNNTQLANRSHLFAPDGTLVVTYDKIHMFDVTLSRAEFYNESKDNKAGESLIIADLGFAKLGMSICYDVRFPHLHRDLAKAGAQIISIPAAFTVPTGKAHWEILLRARAIETGAFILAPAQVGEHEGGRQTYGHSMIIGPWGEILAEKTSGTGIIIADLNLEEVAKARQSIPALTHDRAYKIP